ncbi:hypothetical protein G9A89_009091 [Geosiphon pyriformis]|nr:hypothetical protein G9A89_009091 [Geosiphon pyriformis]
MSENHAVHAPNFLTPDEPISDHEADFTPARLASICFSSFPHGTCSLSVSRPYLALDGIYHPFRAAIPNNSTLRERNGRDPAPIALYYPLINTILNDSGDDALLLEWVSIGDFIFEKRSDAKNSDTSPEKKAKIGHKVDFKITLENSNYVLQIVHGEVSGGIKNGKPEACKSKQWLDKLKLMVMLRDELNQLIKTYSKLDGAEFLSFAVYESCEIEQKHARKRRRPICENQYNFEKNLVCTRTLTKQQK